MTAPAPRCPTCGSLLAAHDERQIVRDATARMLRALELDSV